MAELSFGFLEDGDAYLGLMLLGPWAQGAGHGGSLLADVERLARNHRAPRHYLAVFDANLQGRAYWERAGFRDTGVMRQDPATGHRIIRLVKPL